MEKASWVAEKVLMASASLALLLGLFVWITGNYEVIGLHQLLGYALIASLWTLAAVAIRSGVRTVLVAGAVAWSVLVLAPGWGQEYLVTGSWHWIVRVAHLVISMSSVAWGRLLAASIRRSELRHNGRVPTPVAR